MATTFYCIRHAEVHNPKKLFYGRMDGFSLSITGQGQASAAGNALADRPLKAVFTSPMQRAQETAQILASPHLDLAITADERLNEVHTPHDGRPISELAATNFDLYTGNQAPHESPADVLNRLQAFFVAIRQSHRDQELAVVTHGDLIAMIYLYAVGAPVSLQARMAMGTAHGYPAEYPPPASINAFTFYSDEADERPEFGYQKPY